MPYITNLRQKVRDYRKANNLTQKQFAFHSGFILQTISKWENIDRDLDFRFADVVKLASALEITPEELIYGHRPDNLRSGLWIDTDYDIIKNRVACRISIYSDERDWPNQKLLSVDTSDHEVIKKVIKDLQRAIYEMEGKK